MTGRRRNGSCTDKRSSRRATAGLARAGVLSLALACASASAGESGDLREDKGVLPDGAPYLIRVPAVWNGTLIRDMDFATAAEAPARADEFADMLARGYAVAGTARHRLREWQYDPAREIADLDQVQDLFQARYGKPRRVIQYGCSGGGHVTLAVAEDFHGRVDGSVALAAHNPVWLMNTFLDGWFALRALIGETYASAGHGALDDLKITDIPSAGVEPITAAWRKAIEIAQVTPEGRARIALAFALGQWPAWVTVDTAEPARADADALQQAMYRSAMRLAENPGGAGRSMFENAAQGQQLSGNEGVDYARFFENANGATKDAVRALYRKAGLDLAADLAKVNATPRIHASEYARSFWSAPGRVTRGEPAIPVLRLHSVGDSQIPDSLVLGYEAAVHAQGKDAMVRTAFGKFAGHCNEWTAAESAAAIDTMMKRLDTGAWPDTAPKAMNARARALRPADDTRFTDIRPYRQDSYNRLALPDEGRNEGAAANRR